MKTLRYFANTAFVLSLAMFASCSSDNDIEKNDENNGITSAEELVFTASFEGDEITRAILTKESNKIERMHWQEGDKIVVGCSGITNVNNKYTISSIESNGTKATFTGSSISSDPKYYTAIYPDDATNLSYSAAIFDTEIKTNQVVTSGYSYDKSAMLMIARTTPSDMNFVFKNIPTLFKVTLTNNDGQVKYIRVRSRYPNSQISGAIKVYVDAKTGNVAFNTASGTTNNYVQLEIPDGSSGGTFYIAAKPNVQLSKGFSFELEKADQSKYYYIYTGDVTFGRSNIYDFGTFDVSKLTFLQNVVDLGLPSGTLWCTKNITAGSGTSTTFVNSIYDNGGYYAWGEIYAYGQENGKTTYSSTTYTLGDDIYTTTDDVSTLKDEYDAAYQMSGHVYCMPTYTQLMELYENCNVDYYTSTAYDGHYGVLLTSKINNNTLWLPAAGYHFDADGIVGQSGLNGSGSAAHYWSKTLYPSKTGYAYCLDFYRNGLDSHGLGSGGGDYYDRRLCGKCIRPVVRK